MASRRLKAALAASSTAIVALAVGFGPVVRYQAGRAAERYGGALEIQHVVPTWRGVRLKGIQVAFAEIPSAHVQLDELEVTYGSTGRVLAFRGGLVSLAGRRSNVLREVEAWRARYLNPSVKSGGQASGTTTLVSGIGFRWQDDPLAPTEEVHAVQLDVTRENGAFRIAARDASAMVGRARVQMKDGQLKLVPRAAGGYGIKDFTANGLEGQFVVPQREAAPGGKAERPAGSAENDPTPAGERFRASLIALAKGLDTAIEPGARVELDDVHARVLHGDDAVTLGPGRLGITRTDKRMVVDLAPQLRGSAPAGEREEALTFRLSLPLEDGESVPQEIVADVQGGPIWLSTLGLKEGDLGLFDVGQTSVVTRSHLVLAPDGRTLSLDGEGKIHKLSLRSKALSDQPVAGLEFAFRAKGEIALDGSRVHMDDAELDLGALRLLLKGDYERTKGGHRVRTSFDVPLTPCQAMLDSTPRGLVPKIQGMRMAGSFGLRGKTSFDTAHLDRAFGLDWDISNTCRIVEAPAEVSVTRFSRPFQRTAYDSQGKPVNLEAGPGTQGWVPLSSISKFMSVAVFTTEDGGFMRHHGFDQEAIRNSIRENLRKKKFVRGASTISMQLAKNLYLDRGKNLSRKLQEAILTMYLEQELTKDQLLELYLNVVEFGPMIYGIGPAARHYFNTTAGALSLGQALYISSIMPNPRVQHFGAGGAVTRGWTNYLRKLMRIAHDRHRITDEELEEGLCETLVRGVPAPRREPATPPGFLDGDGDGEGASELPPEPGD